MRIEVLETKMKRRWSAPCFSPGHCIVRDLAQEARNPGSRSPLLREDLSLQLSDFPTQSANHSSRNQA